MLTFTLIPSENLILEVLFLYLTLGGRWAIGP